MEKEKTSEKKEGLWLKVFCPDARCLTEEEVVDLPQEKKDLAKEAGGKGLWLEVFCPDESCLAEEEKAAAIPVKALRDKGKKGFWLNMFCPEDRCVVEQSTDLA
jgi:hypothetical protein